MTPLLEPNLAIIGPIADRCQSFVDQMIWRESELGNRKRSLKEQDKLSRYRSANMLLANLYQQWKADPKGTIGVMLTKHWYSDRRAEIGPHITHAGVTRFLDFLSNQHLIEIVSKGRKHPDAKQGLPTQVPARRRLIDYPDQGDVSTSDVINNHPPIILKSSRVDGRKEANLI